MEAEVYNQYMEKSKSSIVATRCGGTIPSHEECTEH